jgi:hypothetical protein
MNCNLEELEGESWWSSKFQPFTAEAYKIVEGFFAI